MSSRERRGVILVVTHAEDDHVPAILRALAARDADVLRLDTESFPQDAAVTFTANGGPPGVRLHAGGRSVRGDEIGAVLFRHRRLPQAPGVAAGDARRLAENELLAALDGCLLSLSAHWVNHPHANRLARHKLLQLTLASELGFAVPDTCVSADPEEIRAAHRAWGGRMIAKLVGGQLPLDGEAPWAVMTTRIEPEDLADDGALAACPAIYQREVEKDHELRVTVVGDRTLTCRIDAPETEDWRRTGMTHVAPEPVELAPEVAARCVALTQRLRLRMAGLDLIVTPEGGIVFLELNAVGRWAWVEEATGLPIAAAVADELLAAPAEAAWPRG